MIKFVLRRFRKGDEASLQRNINKQSVYRHTLSIPHPYTMRHARDWVGKNTVHNKKEIHFAIDIGGEVCGGIGFSRIERNHKAELGYWLAEQFRGKGIMTAAVKQMLKLAFGKLELRRVYAYINPANKASARVLEKNGFVLEGSLKKAFRKKGRLLDSLLYAKVK